MSHESLEQSEESLPPSPEEIEMVVDVLRRLKPGFQDRRIFEQTARLNVMSTVEMAPLRKTSEGKTQILLTQRAADDPFWPNEWHIPGTFMLTTDKRQGPHDHSDEFKRIFGDKGELGNSIQLVSEPVFVDSEMRDTRRGTEHSAVHYAEVTGEPTVGRFFDADQFPYNVPTPGVVEHQINCITIAVKRFETDNR